MSLAPSTGRLRYRLRPARVSRRAARDRGSYVGRKASPRLTRTAPVRFDASIESKPSLTQGWEMFGDFHDSLIRRVELRTATRGQLREVAVELDALSLSGEWYDLRFHFTGVEEYRFWQGNFMMEVIFGAHWARFSDRVYGELVYVAFDEDGIDLDAPTVERSDRPSHTWLHERSN